MPTCPLCNNSYEGDLAYCPACSAGRTEASGGGEADGSSEQAGGARADALKLEVLERLTAGDKIGAIKVYRERTGDGLAEAKRAVELIESPLTPINADLQTRLLMLLRNQEKIAAIRLYRQEMHCDLKAAKDAVEELQRRHGIASKGGCAGMALAFVFAIALLSWQAVAAVGGR